MREFISGDGFEPSMESFHGFLLAEIAASKEYQSRALLPGQSQESRVVQIRGYDHALISSSTLRNRSEEHTSELQSLAYLVCRLLLEKKKNKQIEQTNSK